MSRANLAFLLTAAGWMGLLFYLSSRPTLPVPPLFPGQDKLLHAGAYAVLGFLLMGALHRRGAARYGRRVLAVTLLAMLYGISDEWHQHHVPGRSADLLDIVADTAGGLLGALGHLKRMAA